MWGAHYALCPAVSIGISVAYGAGRGLDLANAHQHGARPRLIAWQATRGGHLATMLLTPRKPGRRHPLQPLAGAL